MPKLFHTSTQMQRLISSSSSTTTTIPCRILHHNRHLPPYDVFINHRGVDTKRNVAGLLFEHLSRLGVSPFLDYKNMKPGDELYQKIDEAILGCKVGVAIFSPRYCESYYCLHELALIMEAKKKVIPLFCGVKPCQLIVEDDGSRSQHDSERFRLALGKAKSTVGLFFDPINGDWPEFLTKASDAVIKNLAEMEEKV